MVIILPTSPELDLQPIPSAHLQEDLFCCYLPSPHCCCHFGHGCDIPDSPVSWNCFATTFLLEIRKRSLQPFSFERVLICIIGTLELALLDFFIKFFVNVSLSDVIIATLFLGPFSVADKISNILYREK